MKVHPAGGKNGIRMKRIYEASEPGDGIRILVDRIWPRGVSREQAQLTWWLKEVAPSTGLRQWFDHKPERLEEFSRRYLVELQDPEVLPRLEQIRSWAIEQPVTLLYAAKDERCNHVVVLKRLLEQQEHGSW